MEIADRLILGAVEMSIERRRLAEILETIFGKNTNEEN